jgi:hypothetical protein
MWPENFVDASPLMSLVLQSSATKIAVADSAKNDGGSVAAKSAHKKSCACLDCCG